MKRIVSFLIIILLAVLPALSEPSFSTFDHVVGRAGGGRYIFYDFPDVTLYLPIEWDGRYTVRQSDDGASFYQTASHEKYLEEGFESGGLLFKLCASEDERFRDLPAFAYLGYSENVGLHFYLMLPTDLPAYPDDDCIAEYDEMAGQIDAVVVALALIGPNMSFYPGDDIGLDGNDLG